MTCIVGLEHEGKVYIGADSASVGGWEVKATRLRKVFQRSRFLIGYTGSFRMGQLLQHQLTVTPQNGESDEEYMVCKFVEAVRTCLKDGGFAKVENNVDEGGQFIIGFNGQLYLVDDDFQVNSMAQGFYAVGCGRGYALGAMKVLNDLPPKQRIRKALETAAYFSGAVCKPFRIKVL